MFYAQSTGAVISGRFITWNCSRSTKTVRDANPKCVAKWFVKFTQSDWVIDRPNGCECVAVCMCVPCTNSGVVIRFAVTFIWVSLDGVWRMVCHSFSPELLKKVDGTSILCVCVHACVCVHLYCYSNNNRWHKHSMGSSKPIAVGSTRVTADRCMMLINSLLWVLGDLSIMAKERTPKGSFLWGHRPRTRTLILKSPVQHNWV